MSDRVRAFELMLTSLSSKTYRNTAKRVLFSTESTSLMLNRSIGCFRDIGGQLRPPAAPHRRRCDPPASCLDERSQPRPVAPHKRAQHRADELGIGLALSAEQRKRGGRVTGHGGRTSTRYGGYGAPSRHIGHHVTSVNWSKSL
jgi:hypothetical protein